MPARGAIEYQYVILPSRLTEDRWIQKVEVRPSNPAVVHHAVVYIREPGSTWLRDSPVGVPFSLPRNFTTSDVLLVYTPGNSLDGWPARGGFLRAHACCSPLRSTTRRTIRVIRIPRPKCDLGSRAGKR